MCIVALMERQPPRFFGSGKNLTRSEIKEGVRLIDHWGQGRPESRSECGVDRPCLFVSCRYNLYLDVNGRRTRFNFPHLEPSQMSWSCVLDEVEASPDGMTLQEVGDRMNITRERVRQLQNDILDKLRWLAHYSLTFQKMIEAWEVKASGTNRSDEEFTINK